MAEALLASDPAAKASAKPKKKKETVPLPSLLACANVKAPQTKSPAAASSSTSSIPRGVVDQATAHLTGVWSYTSELSYEINRFTDKLFYQEFNSDRSLFCQGELVSQGKFLVGNLTDANRVAVGTIRLHYKAATRELISSFKDPVGDWQPETAAKKQASSKAASTEADSGTTPLEPEKEQEPGILEGVLGLIPDNGTVALPETRFFVLRQDRLDCYANKQAREAGSQPKQSFWNESLKDLKDGCSKKSISGDTFRVGFIASVAKSLPDAIKKALSEKASKGATKRVKTSDDTAKNNKKPRKVR